MVVGEESIMDMEERVAEGGVEEEVGVVVMGEEESGDIKHDSFPLVWVLFWYLKCSSFFFFVYLASVMSRFM